MSTQYYILRWKGSSLQKDEFLSASENLVRIGQKDDCDVRLPNDGPFEDELFAVIKPSRSADGWQIIPTSPSVRTLVNGIPVCLTHYLRSGDRISFGETDAELSFEVRHDNRHGAETVHYSALSRRMMRLIAGVAAAVVLLLSFGIGYTSSEEGRVRRALRKAGESIFCLEVDSVYYVRSCSGAKEVLRRASIAQNSGLFTKGTAFLTVDSQLITARHCIEPWLNFNQFYGNPVPRPLTVAWAMEAETWNQLHPGDTSFHLETRIRILDKKGKEYATFRSGDFRYDNSRDEIIEFGDFSKEEYWRSITGRFNRSDMMLGDIALLSHFGRKGVLRLIPEQNDSTWLQPETSLHFKGFPRRIESRMESREGKIISEFVRGHMISHNGDLDQGFSGGPVMMVRNGKIYVVGVVSTYDKESKNCIYSVPVTELPKEEKP